MPRQTVQEALRAAQEREAAARRRVAELKRRVTGADRRRESQRRFALGGVLLAMAARGNERDLAVVAAVRDYLRHDASSNANASNLAALEGTAFVGEVSRG